jgi:hypothetical protein
MALLQHFMAKNEVLKDIFEPVFYTQSPGLSPVFPKTLVFSLFTKLHFDTLF